MREIESRHGEIPWDYWEWARENKKRADRLTEAVKVLSRSAFGTPTFIAGLTELWAAASDYEDTRG